MLETNKKIKGTQASAISSSDREYHEFVAQVFSAVLETKTQAVNFLT